MRIKLKIGDIAVISAVLLSAVILLVFFYFPSDDKAEYVVLRYNDREESYSLSQDRELNVHANGYSLCIVSVGGSVFVKSSDCPDKTCVHMGRISSPGQTVACVPAGLTLTLSGEGADYDFIAG